MESGAIISPDGRFRYRLWRKWSYDPKMAFIMLNPSTADASVDDPTIRRCIGFAKREGCGGIEVINLFALRSSKPDSLVDSARNGCDPRGPENSKHWDEVFGNLSVSVIVAAWGAFASKSGLLTFPFADEHHIERWLCLGKTKDGSPRHPLYVKADQPLENFQAITNNPDHREGG